MDRHLDHIEYSPEDDTVRSGSTGGSYSAGGDSSIDGTACAAAPDMRPDEQHSSGLLSKIGLDDKSLFEESGTARLGEIKEQLNSDSDKEKLVAMKRLFAMISKGRDVSSLFPDVIKNVIAQNVEIRKLVYMFIVHYSEVEPQNALLGINSLQKAMSEHNQMLRASALRCMSNIRVKDIAQLIVLSVQKGAKDSSAHARRTAALAVPKILRLDPRLREQCEELVGSLLADHSSVVLGAAVQAFLEVCPERMDLVHPVFRRMCHVLPDMDEWGQVAVLSLMLRYAREQFTNPDASTHKKPTGEVDEDWVMDPDHRAMLAASAPLMHSRNTAVVLGAAVLHFYTAPPSELARAARALVRLLHAGREAQYVALANIATLAAQHPAVFAENISEFFVRAGEPAATRVLKLEILTRVANERNISRVLREMREYVRDDNKTFVASAVEAVGRCAATIPEVAETCLHQLMQLMASPSPIVAGQSVVVIKRLLQLSSSGALTRADQQQRDSVFSGAAGEDEQRRRQAGARGADESERDVRVIKQLARLLEKITAPAARASIVWVAGEYCAKVPQRATDVLRSLARNFADEEPLVKLQVITLGAKLFLTLCEGAAGGIDEETRGRTESIFRYVLQLSKYDANYDVRDRARVVRQLLYSDRAPRLRAQALRLFLGEKPVPVSPAQSDASSAFTLGTLSHVVHEAAPGYEPLPDFPETAPDPTVRNPAAGEVDYSHGPAQPEPGAAAASFAAALAATDDEMDGDWVEGTLDDDALFGAAEDEADEREAELEWGVVSSRSQRGMYAGDAEGVWGAEDEDEGQQDEQQQQQASEEDVWGASQEPEEEPAADEDDDIWNPKPASQPAKKAPAAASAPTKAAPAAAPQQQQQQQQPKRDPLEDLFGPVSPSSSASAAPALAAQLASLSSGLESLGIAPTIGAAVATGAGYSGPATTERAMLLKPVVSGGLSAEYWFSRMPSLYGADVCTVVVGLRNTRADRAIINIRLGKVLESSGEGVRVVPFPELRELPPMASADCPVSVHFASASKPVRIELCTADGTYPVTLAAPAGEHVRPPLRPVSLDDFAAAQKRLGGMFACEQDVDLPAGVNVPQRVQEAAYVARVDGPSASDEEGAAPVERFACEAMADGQMIVVAVTGAPGSAGTVAVHSENTALGTMLLNTIVAAILRQ
eukprot:m51a1_g13894 Adaptor protein complex 3 (AP-3), beta subunit (1175) ;mRNA; r:711313-716670